MPAVDPEAGQAGNVAGNVMNWPALACYLVASVLGVWAAWRSQGDTAAISAAGAVFGGLSAYFGWKGPGITMK